MSPAESVVKIVCQDLASAKVSELTAEIRRAAECFSEIRQALVDFPESIVQTRSLNRNRGAAARAGDPRIMLQPTQLLRQLVPAFRAVNCDLVCIQKRIVHVGTPRVKAGNVKHSKPSTGSSRLQKGRRA